MEEKVIKESKAHYFKSAVNLLEGYLVLTNKRIVYSGQQVKVEFDHGAIGNIVRDKMENAMGFGPKGEEFIFDIPLEEAGHKIKRFGLSKRLVITDKDNKEYSLTVNKSERDEWPIAIDNAKKEIR